MTNKDKDDPKLKNTTVYVNLNGLRERAYILNQKAGKPGSEGAMLTIHVELARKTPGDKANVSVRFVDGSWGLVRDVERVDAERWAKRVGNRVGAKVFIPAWALIKEKLGRE